MLLPDDYSAAAIRDPEIARLIDRMEIVHGGPEYDARYPEGIPTSVMLDHAALGTLGGNIVAFPLGHARSDAARTAAVVDLKFDRLVAGAVDDPAVLRRRVGLAGKTAAEVAELYAFPIRCATS
jgi:2-methylcitrate dehydratase